MSAREWKPGDVGVVTTRSGQEYRAVYTLARGIDYFWRQLGEERLRGQLVDPDVSARPLVVIDPEDRVVVERLVRLFWDAQVDDGDDDDATYLQAALREFTNPTQSKPTVYEHVVYQKRGKTVEAVCGKLWIPDPEVTIVGRCPSCREIAGRWVA